MKLFCFILTLIYSVHLPGQCTTYPYEKVFDESWLSCLKSPHTALDSAAHWISFDLGSIRRLGTSKIWNFNEFGNTASGINEITIFHSNDGVQWYHGVLDTVPEASGLPNYNGVDGPDFTGISARYLLISGISNHGGLCTGFSEIQIFFDEQDCVFSEVTLEFNSDVCSDTFTTTVTVLPVNGTAPFIYLWSTNDTTAQIINVPKGDYAITVVDANGCTKSVFFEIDISEDSILINNVPIPPNIYFGIDTMRSHGKVGIGSEVTFLFSDALELEPKFEVAKFSELLIAQVDCAQMPANSSYSYGYNISGLDLHYYKTFIGNGNDAFIEVVASDESPGTSAQHSISGLGPLSSEAAARFLSQSTLGYDKYMIEQVSDIGVQEWIEWQLCQPKISYTTHLKNITRFGQPNINYWLNFHRTWWHNTLSGENYLQEKIAYALSQIFVISSKSFLQNYGDGLTSYYDILLKHSFGNYRDLLFEVTMHSTMGVYLSHLNNPKADTLVNQFPDENFAREVLQLFSIGLYDLNLDGTEKVDSLSNLIPTYSNEEIIEFAKIFTGLGFKGEEFGRKADVAVGLPITEFMIMNEEFHEPGEKYLFYNTTIPSGQTGMKDINDALDNIFNHPNVGPFISLRLIQRLVKSNPTPDYITRVATIFNNNGNGVRGDLGATVRAILLDPEARDCSWLTNNENGKLREPIERMIHLLKAFNISNETNTFYALGATIEEAVFQAPLRAPSVFNFFQFNHSAPGILANNDLYSPEFQIADSYSTISYTNLVDSISLNQNILDVEEGIATLNFDEEISAAQNDSVLIDLLDYKLTYGNLSPATRTIVENALVQVGIDPLDKVRMATYLIANSLEFLILK